MPSRVEDYEILTTIGSGSYGRCQRIRRKCDSKILVWKEMAYGTMSEVQKQMLVSEVNLLRELRHPNIVRYYDRIIDRTNTTLYIVMEYCEGGDLAKLISKCVKDKCYLHEDFILRIFTQLCLALKECHRKHENGHTVLHRDIKPPNVFLDAKQNVKLGDFGLARILQHESSFADSFVGTPYYMSPEQLNYTSYNEKSDIWSLGCLLYELCALSPPFTAATHMELVQKIKEGKLRRIPYRYSEELNTVIINLLNLKDYKRPSIEDILQFPLITDLAAEEQRTHAEKKLRRLEEERLQCEDPAVYELKLKEHQLLERQKALQIREEMLEQKERELCIRERLAEEKLSRAEKLVKDYNTMREPRNFGNVFGRVLDESGGSVCSIRRKKVHFAVDSKENLSTEYDQEKQCKEKCLELKKRLEIANLRAKTLCEMEKNYQLKSRQILGMR